MVALCIGAFGFLILQNSKKDKSINDLTTKINNIITEQAKRDAQHHEQILIIQREAIEAILSGKMANETLSKLMENSSLDSKEIRDKLNESVKNQNQILLLLEVLSK